MRSIGLLVASVALAMLLASGIALAKIVEGTNHDDVADNCEGVFRSPNP
jgi:hypothetical protein